MIRLEKISKAYRTNAGSHTVFKDLDLEIPTGSGVAILGRNGAGKTTLINIIGGAEKPDSGRVFTDGRISWPVGLAGGFQPSLTARENIKFVARLYGGDQDVKRILRFVEDFADIGEYFDMPVRTYSSGMRSRVSFGLSMAFDFDYYLIDEVTAVGDSQFKKKCNEALEQKRLSKAGFIVVSHQMDIVNKLCDYVVVLSDGHVDVFDDVKKGIQSYLGELPTPLPTDVGKVSSPDKEDLKLRRLTGKYSPLVCIADQIRHCYFDVHAKKLRGEFHIVAFFPDCEIKEFALCDSSTGVWEVILAKRILSPGVAQKRPNEPWANQSRFVFDFDVNLPARPVHTAIMARCGDDVRPLVRFSPN